ncbi:hypothetical protein CQW23_34807 [Capsicum baccatum]|uniref:Protein TAR1 n=1 Tax=Capsicum baccatum TaxID=33114 RepID=A0A2G2UY56_CAPBA|nr:hypothetical protein CQW23_34807 [Capsicum baccatum]
MDERQENIRMIERRFTLFLFFHGALVPWCHSATAPRCLGAMAPCCLGAMVQRCYGAMVHWCHGALVTWCHGAMAPRQCHGVLVPWCHDAPVPRRHGAPMPWCHGTAVPWCRGALLPLPWCHGALVPWCHGATVTSCLGAMVPVCHSAMVPGCLCATMPVCHGAMVPRLLCAELPLCHGAKVTRCHGAMVPWCHGATVPSCLGAMVPWCHGAMMPRCHGATVPWRHGALVPWCHGATVPWCLGAIAPQSHGALVPWCYGATVPWCHGAMGKTNISHSGLNPTHVPYWWVNNPTLVEFCFTMIGRADIEGSKSNVAMNAWLPQASYPCGNFSDTSSFEFRSRTPLVRTSSELAVRRAGKAPEGTVSSPSPGRHAETRSHRGSSSSNPPTADGFVTGTPEPSPQSQSFSQTYGSILPTSLAYIVPSTRGCSPWRPDAVMSTNQVWTAFGPPDFQGPPGAHQTPRDVRCSSSRWTLPPAEPIPGWAGC